MVCDTRVERGLADTGYEERRKACEDAARTLGVRQLRDAGEEDLERLSGEGLNRARHVVLENARVLAAVQALRGEDFDAFGRLMYDSHRSLRDDFKVSTPELDAFVETARGAEALGARLTGAGFGGCAIALVPADRADALVVRARQAFTERGLTKPNFYRFVPAAGAEVTPS